MRRTLAQLRSDTRILIAQTDTANTDFTDSELSGLLNKGAEYAATLCEFPRDLVNVQVEQDKPAYTLLTDTMKIRTAYFGDVNINGDVRPIAILDEERLRDISPNWLDNTTQTQGRPIAVALLDRKTVLLNPRPNAAESATGKKLYLGYVYYPATMTADGDYPELPDPFHNFIPEYALHLCYLGKLKRPDLAQQTLTTFISKVKSVLPQTTDEITQKFFSFGSDDASEYPVDNVSLSNLRLS